MSSYYKIIIKGEGATGKEHSCSYSLTVKPTPTPPPTPTTTPTTTPTPISKVAFRAYNAQYVCAEGGSVLVANRDAISDWETFEMIDMGDNKVALRAYNEQYVCAEGGGGSVLVANRDAISHWETFEMIKQ